MACPVTRPAKVPLYVKGGTSDSGFERNRQEFYTGERQSLIGVSFGYFWDIDTNALVQLISYLDEECMLARNLQGVGVTTLLGPRGASGIIGSAVTTLGCGTLSV